MYEVEKKYHLQSFSLATLVVMVAYYAIAIFHLPNPISLIRARGGSGEAPVYLIAIYSGVLLLGMAGKAGLLLSLGARRTGARRVIPAFVTVSYYLVLIGSSALAISLLSSRLSSMVSSAYWKSSHWFWVSLLLFLAYSFLALTFYKFGLFQWAVLSNLKVIPAASPVFCLGGPYFLSQNLASVTNGAAIRLHGLLMLVSGALFLIYWLWFSFFDQRYKEVPEAEEAGKKTKKKVKYRPRNAPLEERPVYIGFALFGVSLYLLSVALLDVVVIFAGG